MRDVVENEIRELISNNLNIPKEDIFLKSNLVQDFYADSLDFIEMIMQIESKFDIIIDDEEAERVVLVESVVDLVVSKLSKKEA